ncbi:excinuclease ABC subunit UvrC [Petroclostridium sp. X23]|uniref:excinuclease ABC subunit UvrC n=1 Tax=Petroclostridium sp. X23 TaxID=3045146 RepID=UPI0024AE3817|nr:excinuclease ABC subunit UvrC [Petroclostridium sp. X23]WHH60524.1 excinuclease ABC subunit UvrC [Petroclostridium sp. X23]
MFDIQEQLKNLPDKPGVYIMKDQENNIIYIGKAKILKNRVRQYFQSSKNHSPKVQSMVSNIAEFEYIVTDSELEALVLECNLIKKHRPKYNVLLKDDKHYPYIKITLNEEYPRVLITRRTEKDGAKYFGPYTSTTAVRETIDLIKKVFWIRTCKKVFPRDIGKERPCLNFHIKQCLAPCQGNINVESYRQMFKDICTFLDGKQDMLIEKLTKDMNDASQRLDFEKAASLRDKINSIKQIAEKQKIISSTLSDQDIVAFAAGEAETCVQVFFIRGGKLIGREHFILDGASPLERQETMTSFIKQFYNSASYIPKEIVLQSDIDEASIIESWLTGKRGSKVYITVPRKGEKQKLIQMVSTNAFETLQQFERKIKKQKHFAQSALTELMDALQLKKLPLRIEAYDISNTGGAESVGAMVVFENAEPSNHEYRKFKIKSVKGPNDYESIKEVLFRRLKRVKQEQKQIEEGTLDEEKAKFIHLPDIVLIDGGKGHVHAAKEIVNELGMDIPVFGMVKNDKHRTRGIVTEDVEFNIPIHSNAFKLAAQIQDEVHRVAISYHRNIRGKKILVSELESISGIGAVRRKHLMEHFKSIEKIKKANTEELEKVQGIDKKTAENIYEYFHD